MATIKVLGQANQCGRSVSKDGYIIWKVMAKVVVMMCEALTLKILVLGFLRTALLPAPPDSVNTHNGLVAQDSYDSCAKIVISSCLF